LVGTTPTAHKGSVMAENGYGLAGPGVGKVKSISQYRLTASAVLLRYHMKQQSAAFHAAGAASGQLKSDGAH
ncbi:hypothetical protein P9366_21305, partial [Escherichia coli]|uniref:hypothetical protein n=1 Tax=Escherichia coli TaxID=562 RepID=UPI00389123AB